MMCRALLVAVSMTLSSALIASEDPAQLTPLHVIPTENQSAELVAASSPLRVRLSSPNAQELADALGVKLPANQASFEYVFGRYPQVRGAEARTWLEPTFVIDFTEPEFDPLRQELGARGSPITRPQLVEYVAALLDESNDRGWDLASVVARRRQGDCSEHAVLTTALARQQGIPSRVVVGVVLVADGKNYSAFGHAWSEMLEDGQWRVADAALFDLQAAVRYVPITLMEDEGLGYAMSLMGVLKMWIDRVVVLGP